VENLDVTASLPVHPIVGGSSRHDEHVLKPSGRSDHLYGTAEVGRNSLSEMVHADDPNTLAEESSAVGAVREREHGSV
jgi:hypothetical protein